MKKNTALIATLSCLLLASSSAWAQPTPPDQPEQPKQPAGPDTPPEADPSDGTEQPQEPSEWNSYDALERRARELQGWKGDAQAEPNPPEPQAPPVPFPEMRAPVLLAIPTGHLLPAAVVQASASVDTGGSIGGSAKIGLGDVGEFGIETSPRIRIQTTANGSPETVQPLFLASFRMGVAEDRLFDEQPALALGFKKSFSRQTLGQDIRVAAIDLVASKTFGKTSLHLGGVFWDAEMSEAGNSANSVTMHENGSGRQIRPFGGIEAEPIENAKLLIDLYWVPQFASHVDVLGAPKDAIRLRPTLSWGVRYNLGKRVSFESGVRVPDIGEANLLDAQIFGQFTFSSDKIRRALGVKKSN